MTRSTPTASRCSTTGRRRSTPGAGASGSGDRRGHGARRHLQRRGRRAGLSRRDHRRKEPVRGAKYVFDAWILPELGTIQLEKLTLDRLTRCATSWTQPKRVRSKRTAAEPPPARLPTTRMPAAPAQGHRQPHPDHAEGGAQPGLSRRPGLLRQRPRRWCRRRCSPAAATPNSPA
jgi:hypothetical protein